MRSPYFRQEIKYICAVITLTSSNNFVLSINIQKGGIISFHTE